MTKKETKKEKNFLNKNDIINFICIFVCLLLASFITFKITKRKYEQPEIKSLYIFGEKVKVEPKKKVYRIYMDRAEIKNENNGCAPNPIDVTFKGDYINAGGYEYVENGEDRAYFGIKVEKKNSKSTEPVYQATKKIDSIDYYDFYFEVIFDTPLELDSECGGTIEEIEEPSTEETE